MEDNNNLMEVKIDSINAIGTLCIKFTGDLSVFNASSIKDYERSLLLILKSGLDDELILGKFRSENQDNMALNNT